jgi:drug/metabolite transporter (DMT)-like permease
MYNPFKKTELSRIGAANCETLGTVAFTFAVGMNAILTAPIASSYCLVTIILARILLKEKLTKKQYFFITVIIVGILMLAVLEGE